MLSYSRSKITIKISTDLAPSDLGIQGIGAASITATQFSDKGWILTNLYWQHKFNEGKTAYVIGQIDNTDFLDMYVAINPQTAFMNLNFSTNPTIGIVDQGFGAAAGTALGDNIYHYMLSKHFAITPDLQYIKDPALNPNVSSVWMAGIRARLTI